MIFLSAQPDDYYFLWQLKLQLYNFKLHGIAPESIHILLGYDPEKGLQKEFINLIAENTEVNIHAYPDTRISKLYPSSIRPHIIAKHLSAFPELQEATLFYHDSDIVFKTPPDFSLLNHDITWYASDTRFYLNCAYIRGTGGEDVFKEMCRIVGVTIELVEENDLNAAGAQYLLKKTRLEFWKKVENDCELMYSYLTGNNDKYGFCNSNTLIQAWYTDMWVTWWNSIFYKQKFCIHSELDFAWADSNIKQLDKCKILHYTGLIEKGDSKLFRKNNYVNYPPFYSDLSEFDPNLCSAYLKDLISDYMRSQKSKRINLPDVTFLIPVRIDSEDRLENVYAITQNLSLNFNTNIILTEIDNRSKIDTSKLPSEVRYFFIKDDQQRLHRTKYNNQMILKATTPYIALYDVDVILPVHQVLETMNILRGNKFSAVSPYDGNFVSVDRLLKAMFIKMQDAKLFEENQNKLGFGGKRSYGGAIFLNKEDYHHAGLENEYLTFWGPDDIERVKRLTILGYKVKRVDGNLYHLFHSRGINSGYQSTDEQKMLMKEYLNMCKLNKEELQGYVNTWPWKPQLTDELSK